MDKFRRSELLAGAAGPTDWRRRGLQGRSSAPRRNTATASSSAFYFWEAPGKQIGVRMHLNVIDRLEEEILASEARGVETGGLLLGRIENDGQATIIIEGYEPVPSTYKTSNLYTYSDLDVGVLEKTIAAWQPVSGKALAVAGFYRSSVRGGLAIDANDLDFMSKYFSRPDNVMLVVWRLPESLSEGTFFVWDGGEVDPECANLAFPFNRRQLSGASATKPRVADMPQPDREPRPQPVRVQQPQGREPRSPAPIPPPARPLAARSRSDRWLLLGAGIIAVLGAGLFAFRNETPLSGKQPVAAASEKMPSLELKTQRTGSQWQISWNRNSPAIMAAAGGRLSIQDGYYRKDLDMDGGELRTGSVIYTPVSSEVTLRLEVFDAERRKNVSESLRVISGLPVPGAPVLEFITPEARGGSGPQGARAGLNGSAPGGTEPYKPRNEAPAIIPAVNTRQFALPPAKETPARSVNIDLPPAGGIPPPRFRPLWLPSC